MPARERFEAGSEGYLDDDARERIADVVGNNRFDSLSDLDDEDLEEADLEGEMEKFKTVSYDSLGHGAIV